VGYDNVTERIAKKHRKALPLQVAANRAVNARAYLIEEKGIDSSRVEVRTGTEDAQTVVLWIVPAGAVFEMSNTFSMDESQMKPLGHPKTRSKT